MAKSKCATKWKRAHATKADAEAQLNSMRANGRGHGQHVYQCPEGHWHVGNGHVFNHSSRLKARR